MKKRTLLSWSSGKDSAWALHSLQQDAGIDLLGLFTVLNENYTRVSMHATRLDVLRLQADAAGLPLQTIFLPDPCSMDQYGETMLRFVSEAAAEGIQCMAFGDLFLEDIRNYRVKQLKGTGIEPLFPLWGRPTRQLAEQMLSAGLEAYVSSVDLSKMPAHFAGRKWSRALIEAMPQDCDPCGENGEIHTVVTNGPMFRKPVPVRVSGIVERDGFAYADILAVSG